ncbi:DUF4360 domain-containing protein [Actinomadura terrae]|uniref:DUF4360 domain-containing protein n=1 Tax=Actinomadura terrae TaxID=604353 RepID=UPI001FA771BF|nr:DUF4360 domain-containing protein [Actinomadura terrae]
MAVVALAAIATPIMPAEASPRLALGPDGVKLGIVSLNGSGCPPGTVHVSLRDSKDVFSIIYSSYVAWAGGSSRPIDARKNCQVRLKVNLSEGFTYAVSQVKHNVYADLQDGVSARQKAAHYFTGADQARRVAYEIKGPFANDFFYTDTTPADDLAWRPCGEDLDLHIDTEVRLDKGASHSSEISFVSMDSLSDGPVTTYHFAWKKCP